MPRPCPSALVAKNPVQSIVILGPQHSIMTKLCFTYSSILAIVFLTLMLSGPEAIAQVLTTAYTFPTSGPAAGLIFDRSGNLYGTLVNDGPFGCGSVFELSPATGGGWTQTTLYTFTGGSDGCFPETTLTFDNAGNLFGTTQGDGGLIDDGSVFELSPTSGGRVPHTRVFDLNGRKSQRGAPQISRFSRCANFGADICPKVPRSCLYLGVPSWPLW